MVTGGWIVASLLAAMWGPSKVVKILGGFSLIVAVLQTAPGQQFAHMIKGGQQGVENTVRNAGLGRPVDMIPAGATSVRLVVTK